MESTFFFSYVLVMMIIIYILDDAALVACNKVVSRVQNWYHNLHPEFMNCCTL